MTWTAPKTFVANSVFTAADLNTYLRDNLMETTAAKALNPGSMFITSGNNSITERFAQAAYVPTLESTTSNASGGVNLATAGPAVTVNTDTQAFVFLYCQLYWSPVTSGTDGTQVFMGYTVSGASSIAFDNNKAIVMQHSYSGGGRGQRVGVMIFEDGLSPGGNIFTAKYRVGNTSYHGNFSDRRIAVLPF